MNKKVLMAALLSVVCAASAMAQKTTQVISLKETQARLLDVMSNAYVKPLTVELHIIDSTRVRHKVEVKPADVIDLGLIAADGTFNMTNLRSYGVYKTAEAYNCDVIVAATFNFEATDLLKKGGTLEVVGFPANFRNWAVADSTDLEWIRMEKVQTTSERDKLNAIVK